MKWAIPLLLLYLHGVKSTLLNLESGQHTTSFHLSYFKSCKNALTMSAPEFPYQMIQIIWNLLTKACTMKCQKPCNWSQRATSFTHKVLPLTSMTENTHYKETKYSMPYGMHVWKHSWRITYSTWESHFITVHLEKFNQWETCLIFLFAKTQWKGEKFFASWISCAS